jgi:hypothetical protein
VVLDHGEVMELDGGTHVLTDRNPRASAPAGAVAYPFDGPGVWTPGYDPLQLMRCDGQRMANTSAAEFAWGDRPGYWSIGTQLLAQLWAHQVLRHSLFVSNARRA